MRRALLLPALLVTCLLAVPASAGAAGRHDVIVPITASVLAPPVPVPTTDGRRHLVYELEVGSWTAQGATVQRVDVRDGRSGRVLAHYGVPGIESLLVQDPFGTPQPGSNVLPPFSATTMWFDVVLPRRGPAPSSLVHTVTVNGITGPVGRTSVGRTVVKIAPPLRGNLLVDGNGCCGATPHVHAIQRIDGTSWLSQRYAIDFIQMNRQGHTFAGDPTNPSSYFIFDEPVYAVASGVVTSVLDGRPTQRPPTPDSSLTNYNAARFVTGNHVIVRLRRGVYAMYAHLKKGSMRVKRGDHVRRGEVLAHAGNSGNTTAPHLHFQLMDRNSPLVANGVPYVFDRFTLNGRITSPPEEFGDTGSGTFTPDRSRRAGQLPMTSDVMTFAGSR